MTEAAWDEPEERVMRSGSIEDVERRDSLTKQQVARLEREFTTKVLDLVPTDPYEGMEDPLGIYANNASNEKQSKAKAPARRKGRRKVQENIFRDFGKEHDKSALHEIEVGGIVITRANFKQFWKCDRELSRWKQDLNDHTRNDKLLVQVVNRWQPPVEERGDRRSKKSGQKADSPERDLRSASTSALQLKELQHKLKPRDTKREMKKRFESLGGLGGLFGAKDGSEKISASKSDSSGAIKQKPHPANELEETIYIFLNFLMRHVSTLEEAFTLIDRNGNGILSPSEFVTSLRDLGFTDDLKFFFRMLEKDSDGFINKSEFLNLKPYLLKGLELHRVTIRAVGNAQSSSRMSADTPQQADLDLSGEIETQVQGRQRASIDTAGVPRSEASGGGSQLNSPASLRRRPSGQTDGSAMEGTTDIASDAVDGSPRSGSLKRPPQPRGLPPDAGHKMSAPVPASPHPRGPRLPQMPQTLSLLLFRNADKLHAGEAVFINRWPQTLRDLLNACGKACRPVVGPAEALLYPDLTPVRSCEEVRSGSVYLLKGHEGLDPPPLFFSHQETQHLSASTSAPSLRKMHTAKEAIAADQEIRRAPSPLQLQMTAQSRLGSSWLLSQVTSMPAVGSPPWPSQGLPPSQKSLNKWQADPKLGMLMMWDGLGQLPRHNEYQNWQPVLRSRSFGGSRGSIDQSYALTY